jgi:hypothetical protein
MNNAVVDAGSRTPIPFGALHRTESKTALYCLPMKVAGGAGRSSTADKGQPSACLPGSAIHSYTRRPLPPGGKSVPRRWRPGDYLVWAAALVVTSVVTLLI